MNILLFNNLPAPLSNSSVSYPVYRPSASPLRSPTEPCCINHSVHGHYGQNQRYPLSFISTRLGNIFCAPDGNMAFTRRAIPAHTRATWTAGLSVCTSSLLDSESQRERTGNKTKIYTLTPLRARICMLRGLYVFPFVRSRFPTQNDMSHRICNRAHPNPNSI